MMDFENIILGISQSNKFKPKAILNRVLDTGKVVMKRAYADWGRYDAHKTKLHELGFDLIEIPRRAMTGKNSADIRMVVDCMELAFNDHIDAFALVTGDSDFTPLVSKLREHDKMVIGLGVKEASSKLLIDSCDEFVFYEELEEVVRDPSKAPEKLAKSAPRRKRKGEPAKKPDQNADRRRAEGLYLVLDATKGLLRRYDAVWASMIKQTIVRKHPSFSETYHGYPTFSKLIEDAVETGILKGEFDPKSGNWRIQGVGDLSV